MCGYEHIEATRTSTTSYEEEERRVSTYLPNAPIECVADFIRESLFRAAREYPISRPRIIRKQYKVIESRIYKPQQW